MHPDKVRRDHLGRLTDLPNIGPAMDRDLRRLGIDAPRDLIGEDPYVLYARLCEITGARQDPCVLDVFISITPLPWPANPPGPGGPTRKHASTP